MKFGVVVFPGSNCDQDCVHVLKDVLRQPVATLWHQETSLKGCDAIVLPGGFSYGDYLRTGAVARFSPIMRAVARFAHEGGLVIGICNGFQILLEAGLLPGAMLRNTGLKFICKFVTLRVERTDTPFTNRFAPGQVVRMPIAHNEGRYLPAPSAARQAGTADAPSTRTTPPRRGGLVLRQAQDSSRARRSRVEGLAQDSAPRSITAGLHKALREIGGQVVFRYCNEGGQLVDTANPNGSTDCIAGLTNRAGNVLGLMPHPERASEPELGSSDGRLVFESMLEALVHA